MKHKLTIEALQRKFETKRSNASKRDIKFSLTFKEYCHLFDTNTGYCDYTGLLMSFEHNGRTGQVADNYATVERIDEDKKIGYVAGNICLIRKDINLLKSQTVEKNSDRDSIMTPHDRNMLDKMCHTLYNPTELTKLKQKYLLTETPKMAVAPSKLISSTITTEELNTPLKVSVNSSDKTSPSTNTIVSSVNPELSLAENFAAFGREIESFGAVYKLTFANYKTLMNKVFCQLSKKRFGEDGCIASIFIIDKLAPVEKGNCLVLDKNLCEALDIFTASGKLNVEELKNVTKNLSKLLSK